MYSEGNHTGHLTPDTIREYLSGKLSATDMHQVETHLLECGFCADAVEGFELSERSHIKTDQTLLVLRKKLNQRIKEHERPRMIRWPAWSAAAAIGLAIAGYVVIKQQEEEQQRLAIQQSRAFLETGLNDTLVIFLPEAPEPLSAEKLLAANTGNGRQAESASYAAPSAASIPQAAIAREKAPAAAGRNTADLERRERPVDSPQDKNALAKSIDSIPGEDALVRPGTEDGEMVVVGYGTQRKQPIAGSVYIRGTGEDASGGGTKLLRGRVVAQDTASLPGVTVMVKDTEKVTTTDRQGNFFLEMPEDKNSVVVSMLGFKTDTVRISDSADNILLAMQPAETGLDEVVVVGYGGKKMKTQLRATPAGGTAAYEKYLADSLRYPQQALENGVEGEVVVRFTVRPGGRPAAFRIIRSLGHGCDKEAIRLIEEGPDWVTPVVKGRPQSARAEQTVKFALPGGG